MVKYKLRPFSTNSPLFINAVNNTNKTALIEQHLFKRNNIPTIRIRSEYMALILEPH